MKNTFTGARLEFSNQGLHALVAEAISFRKQLTARIATGEFASQSGWYDALNGYMVDQLENLCATVKRIIYSVPSSDPDALRASALKDAVDTTKKLKDAFDGKSVNTDNLVMPAIPGAMAIPYDLTGADPNIPQPTPEAVANDWGRMFIAGLDAFIVAATNLDSAKQPGTINATEGAQLLALLNQLYAICMLKGGEANKADVPTGVLPAEAAKTFNANGQYDPPSAASAAAAK